MSDHLEKWADKRLQTGSRYWVVVGRDGRRAAFHADKATIEGGCLCLWRTSKYEGVGKLRTPLAEPELVYSVASGGWADFWSASSFDGRAVAVTYDTADVDGCEELREMEDKG
jgi:hypothetical protein